MMRMNIREGNSEAKTSRRNLISPPTLCYSGMTAVGDNLRWILNSILSLTLVVKDNVKHAELMG